jgi:hypothetical protein
MHFKTLFSLRKETFLILKFRVQGMGA